MRRIAYLVTGHWFAQSVIAREPYSELLELIYLPDLEPQRLEAFDVAIVGSRGDADAIAEAAPALLGFWRGGGDLLAFDEPAVDWLPGAAFEWCETNFWWWATPGGDLPLDMPGLSHRALAGIEPGALKWHHHGAYRPPSQATTLVAAPDGGAVMYAEEHGGSGLLLATTMDPDYHTGQGFIPKAEGLLEHLVRWAARGERRARRL